MNTDTSIDIFLKEKIIKKEPHKFTLLSIPLEKAPKTSVDIINSFINLGYSGIVVTLIKDYREIVNLFFQNKIEISKLYFIDGISRLYGISEADDKNVSYVSGPLSLDEISKVISEQLKSIVNEKKFIYIDSVTSILLYNSIERTNQFILGINKIINTTCPVVGSLYDEGNIKQTLSSGLDDNVNMLDYVSS